MDPKDIDHFRDRLEAIKIDILGDLALEDPTKESITPDKAIGRLTRMEAIQAQSHSSAGRRRLQQRLQKVERALTRIEEGRYGDCLGCGDPIPRGRLEIMPESGFCITCAARR